MANELTIEQVIATYIKFREEKEALEATVKDAIGIIKIKLTHLEAWLQAKAAADGVTSFKTTAGTAFLTTSDYASVADWDAVLKFIKDNDAWDMLEKRVSKNAVRGYIDANKAVPSGVNFGSRVSISVRRPAKTAE